MTNSAKGSRSWNSIESCRPVPETMPISSVVATRPPTEEDVSTTRRTVDVVGLTFRMRPTRPSPLITVISFSMPSSDPASIPTVHAKS